MARKYGSFPIILETYRECLQDVFDLPALKRLLAGAATRQIDLVDVETGAPRRSRPRSSSTTSRVHVRGRHALAERRAQALSLDRDLLRELLGQEELRDLLDPEALEQVERQLRRSSRVTPTSCTICCAGAATGGRRDRARRSAAVLGRAPRHSHPLGGEERLIAAEDAGRYRDALGVMPPSGLPDAFLRRATAPLRSLVHGGRAATDRSRPRGGRTLGLDVEPQLLRAGTRGAARPGELRPAGPSASGATRTSCAGSAAPRWPPSPGGRAGRAGGVRALPPRLARDRPAGEASARRSSRCRRCRCRSRSGRPRCSRGEFPTTRRHSSTSCARPASSSGSAPGLDRVAVFFREDAAVLGQPAGRTGPRASCTNGFARRSAQRAVLVRPRRRGRCRSRGAVAGALGSRRAGEVTNDASTPLEPADVTASEAGAPAAPLLPPPRDGDHGDAGRWSLADRLFCGQAGPPRAVGVAVRAPGDRRARRRSGEGDRRRLRALSTAS